MADAKKKAKSTAPTRTPAKATTRDGESRANGEACKFITRTVHAIVAGVRRRASPRPTSRTTAVITIRSHEPGESVPCRFTVGARTLYGGDAG